MVSEMTRRMMRQMMSQMMSTSTKRREKKRKKNGKMKMKTTGRKKTNSSFIPIISSWLLQKCEPTAVPTKRRSLCPS